MSIPLNTPLLQDVVERCLEDEPVAWTDLFGLILPPLWWPVKCDLLRFDLRDDNCVDEVLERIQVALPDATGGRLRAYRERQGARGAQVDQPSLHAFLGRMVHSKVRGLARARRSRALAEGEAARQRPPEQPGLVTEAQVEQVETELLGMEWGSLRPVLCQAIVPPSELPPEMPMTPGNRRQKLHRLRKKVVDYIAGGKVGDGIL